MNHLYPNAEVPGATATSLPTTASGRKPWEAPKDTQRFIPVPNKPYPSLAEGQRLLGMSDAEFRKLYVSSLYPLTSSIDSSFAFWNFEIFLFSLAYFSP